MFWEELYIRSVKLTLMYQLFYKYLILNQRVSVPGLGNFYVDKSPAHLDFIHKRITPPESTIGFKDDAVILDKPFIEYLKKELKLQDVDVLKTIQDFSHRIRQGAEAGGISLPGIGKLQSGYEGNLLFLPEKKQEQSFKAIDLQNPIYTHAKLIDIYDYSGESVRMIEQVYIPKPGEKEIYHHGQKEDYWWVYAIILAIMGMAALFYYYI